MTPEVVAALEAAALGGDFELRAAAAQALGRRAPDRAAAMAAQLLSDRVSFHRLTLGDGTDPGSTLRPAARQVHYHGVVLPGLIERGDVESLAVVAEDRSLPEATRLGAVEGLAAMAQVPAEDVLRRIGLNAEIDEELRKAAWRALRRSGRMRRKAGAAKAGVKP
jgi:ParB family transcriptional regulator, chromosome partitioning protein